MRSNYLFTSESVSEGHPDKVSDQISDAIVDLFLSKDPEARVACETLTTTQLVVLAGEVRGNGMIDREGNWAPGAQEEIQTAVRNVVREIGYEQDGFHWQNLHFENHLHPQSADIAQGVDATGNKDEGAGDQGIMFGFACDETPDLMPATLYYSHKILEKMAEDRHSGAASFLGPGRQEPGDAALRKRQAGRRDRRSSSPPSTRRAIMRATRKRASSPMCAVVAQVIPAELLSDATVYHINPTGKFVIGGPDGDAGLTGRKIIVDTYGGAARMAAARSPARIRPRSIARRPMPPAISPRTSSRRASPSAAPSSLPMRSAWPKPLSIYVDTHGTGTVRRSAIAAALAKFEALGGLTPRGIRTHLGLNKPIYSPTAAYGHFGRTPDGEAPATGSSPGRRAARGS
jgi:S-adenosylmethionine synthetase